MKKLTLTGTFLLAFGMYTVAQSSPSTTADPNRPAAQSPSTTPSTTSPTTTTRPRTDDPISSPSTMPETTPQASTNSTSSTSSDQTSGTTGTYGTQTTTNSTTAANTNSGTMGNKSIVGCLSSSGNGSDTLTLAEKHNRTAEVIASSDIASQLPQHVGHKVRLRGEWVKNDTASMNRNRNGVGSGSTSASATGNTSGLPQSDQPNAGSNKHNKQFRAEQVEMLSENCDHSSDKSRSDNMNKDKSNR